MDLEIAKDYEINQQGKILKRINEDFNKIKIPFTTFSTSEAASLFTEELRIIYSSGNEIGCHGLNHGRDENYKYLNMEIINSNIQTSTDNIGNIVTEKPSSFRGPGMSTSATTQSVLTKTGYKADFSVCPQRLDFINTKGGDIRWLFSPRLPYHPSKESPYRKGNSKLWVIPLSGLGFPFISGMLYIFGMRFMKLLFQLLLKESLRNKNPIVYLFHSYESTKYVGKEGLTNDTSGINRNRRSFIHNLYSSDPEMRYSINFEFIKYMMSFDVIRPYTGKEFTERLNNKTI